MYAGHPGKKLFNDYAVGLWTVGAGNPANKTNLDNLANVVASDFYNFRSMSYDVIYMGIVAPDMDATTYMTEWSYIQDECQTRQMTEPWNEWPEELHHHDGGSASICMDTSTLVTTETPCIIEYGPPWKCVSGQLQVTRYKTCLIDGRIQQTFVSTDIIS